MKKITFAGIKGTVVKSSPHGNYLVVELSDRITICGTYSNQFNWEETPDLDSGFEGFITYIGDLSEAKLEKWKERAIALGGYFRNDEDIPRPAKRVEAYPLEIKVRGLLPEDVVELINLG